MKHEEQCCLAFDGIDPQPAKRNEAQPRPEIAPVLAFDAFIMDHGPIGVLVAAAVLFVGGVAKGAVGFALPMIALSGLGAFLPAQTAVAILILPTFASNFWQMLRDGVRPAFRALREYRLILLTLLPTIALSAQLLVALPDAVIFSLLGATILLFSLAQLLGLRLPDPTHAGPATPLAVGLVAGFFGGISGLWGFPVMMYLIARNTLKEDQIRALGLMFVMGATVLLVAHSASGVLDARTAPLSAAGIAPVALGMLLGAALNRRMNQRAFRRATLVVLALSGLNLLRRGLLG